MDDIDLFPGAMAERPVLGGLVGPTFACILAQQFSNLRKGNTKFCFYTEHCMIWLKKRYHVTAAFLSVSHLVYVVWPNKPKNAVLYEHTVWNLNLYYSNVHSVNYIVSTIFLSFTPYCTSVWHVLPYMWQSSQSSYYIMMHIHKNTIPYISD